MTKGTTFTYRELSLAEFIDQYESCVPKARLFELTLPWLVATQDFMLPVNSEVIVHCLFEEKHGQALVAWPLVHNTSVKPNISSLTSFYSSVAEPIFFIESNREYLRKLLSSITQTYPWHTMQLGAFSEGVLTETLKEHFPYLCLFANTHNIYQKDILDYQSYYQQRPSQLRNTLKRREKKLAKSHQYRIEIVTDIDSFPLAFLAYKAIYQQSWKGDEYSFDFIEQVCLAALAENKLRLGLLFVDDEPAAAQLWFLQSSDDKRALSKDNAQWQTTASIFKLAYSPKYQIYSVGSLLSLALSEHVISQDNVSAIEFGMGSEPYKKDWLIDSRVRQSYWIFNPDTIYGKLAIIRNIVLPRLVNIFTRKTK
jgi:hypothetical protein